MNFFKKIVKNPFFWAFLIGIFSLHLVREISLRRRALPEPMVIVPDWKLTNQHNVEFGQKELKGKPVIMNYFFTSCPTVCPKVTQSMKDVYNRFLGKEDKVNFVGITVDPEYDSPSVLSEYARKFDIEKPNWYFLTGTRKEVYDVVVNKMKVHMGEKEKYKDLEGVYDIPHLAHIALFDKNGNLRGLFKPEPIELAALVRATNFLIENPEK